MKSSVLIVLGGSLFVILLSAYLISYATTVRDPVEWKNGDLIVLNAPEDNTLPLFAADGSGYTQIGIVATGDDGATVIATTEKVAEIPLRHFLAQAQDNGIAVFRIESLKDDQRTAVVTAARRQLGKANDYYFARGWDRLYSSEFVRLAYNDIGLNLGRLTRIGKLKGDLGMVQSQFSRNWTANDECRRRNLDLEGCWGIMIKQEVVTPASIVADANMKKIYEVKAEKPETFATYMTDAGQQQ
jgi:hypothetical protein